MAVHQLAASRELAVLAQLPGLQNESDDVYVPDAWNVLVILLCSLCDVLAGVENWQAAAAYKLCVVLVLLPWAAAPAPKLNPLRPCLPLS